MKCLVFSLTVMVAINGMTAAPSKETCVLLYSKCNAQERCCDPFMCVYYPELSANACLLPSLSKNNRPIGDTPSFETSKKTCVPLYGICNVHNRCCDPFMCLYSPELNGKSCRLPSLPKNNRPIRDGLFQPKKRTEEVLVLKSIILEE